MSKKKQNQREDIPGNADTPLEDGALDMEAAPPEENNSPEDAEALRQQLEAARKQSEEYLNMAQRVQADFENFRRRNNAARAESFEEGARAFIQTILPVMDNLERALAAETADEAFREGVSMVYRQLADALEKRGVTVIDRQGEKFDPGLENAVLQGTAEEGEPGTVCAVLQKGYRMGDFVLRHAMVKVVAE